MINQIDIVSMIFVESLPIDHRAAPYFGFQNELIACFFIVIYSAEEYNLHIKK